MGLVDPVGVADECGDEGIGGTLVHRLRGSILQDFPVVHQNDGITHAHRLFLVVGDEDRGGLQGIGHGAYLGAHLFPKLGVQGGKRFVEQDASGVGDDGPGQRDPLLLSAGEVGGPARCEIREPYGGKCRTDPIVQILLITSRPERKRHVLIDAHMGPQGEILEYEADVPLLRRDVDAIRKRKHRLSIKQDPSAIRDLKTCDHPKQRRLPASGRPKQCGETPVLDGQADIINDRLAIKRFRD